MEVLSQVQAVVVEHAFTIGVGLLVAVILAGIAWYSMSRLTSSPKSDVLVNQARMNEGDMNPNQMPNENESNGQEESENVSDMMQQVQGDMEAHE